MSWMKKRDPHAHFEGVKFDNGASKYCLKEETRLDGPWEFGKKPVNRASKEDWDAIKESAKAGNMDDIPSDIYVRCYNQLKRIEKDHMTIDGEASECRGIWIYGPAGICKSRKARDEYPNAYKKLANKWWDGYKGEEYVLLEDLDKFHVRLGYDLKL